MRRLLTLLALLLAASAAAAQDLGQDLGSLCDDVDPAEGLCEVHVTDRQSSWGRLYAQFFDPSAFDKAIAVVVGVGAYRGGDYQPLSGRREDAERMRDFLIDDADFDIVITLTDAAASKDRIELLMGEELPRLLGENDRFFFHFSGHGETRKLEHGRRDRGYLVMAEARGRGNYTNMISMSDVQEWSLNIARARQSLWLIDACFSGLASPEPMSRTANPPPGEIAETTRRRLAQRGHHMLTAGLDEETSLILDGRSVFTNAFIDAIQRGDVPSGGQPPDGFIALTEIEAFIVKAVDREVALANERVSGRDPYKMSPRRAVLHADDGQFFFLDRAVLGRPAAPSAGEPPRRIETGGPGDDPGLWRGDGRTWIVDSSGDGDHRTLSAAVAAAQSGDIIRVRPGHYRDRLIVEKPLEIIGEGDRSQVILEGAGGNAIEFNAPAGRISDLTIRQGGGTDSYVSVYIRSGRLVLERNDISSADLSAVEVTTGADPIIRRNVIHDSRLAGIALNGSARGRIESNDIFGNVSAGIAISAAADPLVRANTIRDGKAGGVFVYKGGRGRIEDNDIFGNAFAGVEIKALGDPLVRGNTIRDGKQAGVLAHENGRGRIEDNDIVGNASVGLEIAANATPVVAENTIARNAYQAIWIRSAGGGTFHRNDLRGNTGGAWLIDDNAGEFDRVGNLE